MEETQPDVLAKLRFLSTKEGGRETPTPPDRLHCIFEYEDEGFDCILLLTELGALSPGQGGTVPIVFLYPQYIKDRLELGAKFLLRDYRVIGAGEVCEVLD